MRYLLFPSFMLAWLVAQGQIDSVTISGQVTDFDGLPVEGALIMLKGDNFAQFQDTTHSDKSGRYTLKVRRGKYSALAAVRMSDYGKTKLEFWAWEIPAYEDLVINPRYDRLEVYGVNAFQVHGAAPGCTIYFRPMSLTRFASADPNAAILDIAPPPDQIDIQLKIDGERVKVISAQRVEETAGQQKMYAYLIQADKGKLPVGDYATLQITVVDKETGDRGEAIYFMENARYAPMR